VGAACVNRVTGGPNVEHREGDDWSGIEQVRVRYAQLRRVCGAAGHHMQLEEWGRLHGTWLQTARGDGAQRWSAHTRHGFRPGVGAAHRKEVETVAVGPDGAVYAVAPPGTWPWLVEYEAVVRCATGAAMLVRLRLKHGQGETVAVGVSAWPADAQGKPTRCARVRRQQVNVQLDSEPLAGAARELFWVFGWPGGPQAPTGMRGALMAAAEAAETGRDWVAVQRTLGGALPQQTMAERMQEKREREALQAQAEEAAAAAEAAAEQVESARRRRHAEGGSAAAAAQEERTDAGRAVEAAAAVLDVAVGATHAVVKKKYLVAALRTHPDKPGGEAAKFRKVNEAYEELCSHTPEERRRLVGEEDEARQAATRDAAAAGGPVTDAEMARLEAEEEEACRAAVEKKAAAAAPKVWQRVTERLRAAAAAYFEAWQAFQSELRRRREGAAIALNHTSHAARCAAEAVQRRERARADKEAADAAAMAAMRAKERRVMERLTLARRAEAAELRELSGRRLREAIEADWEAVRRAYRVKVPWAAWCIGKCTCPRQGGVCQCQHKDSRKYESYFLGGQIEGEGEGASIWVDRAVATPKQVQSAKELGRSSWNAFRMPWRWLSGAERFGRDELRVLVEPQGPDSSDESSADEEEQELERAELRRARRLARAAMEAAAAAEAAERLQAEHGVEADALMRREEGTAAEGAWWEEEEEEEAAAAGSGDGGGGAPAGEAVAGGATGSAAAAAVGRGRAGRRWWKEAWMGMVAAADFTESWGRQGLGEEVYSPRTRQAQRAAARKAAVDAGVLGREAAKVAAAEAQRRGRTLRMATAAAADTAAEEGGVEQVAAAAEAWRARDGRAAVRADAVLAREAGVAARRLQRERPAASPASQATRAKVVRAVAQVLVAIGAAAKRGEAAEAAKVDRACEGTERRMGAQLNEHARTQLRAMVEAVLRAQGERGEEESDSNEEEAGGAPEREKGAPTAAQERPAAERATRGGETHVDGGAGTAAAVEGSAAEEGKADGAAGRRMGRVDIGKYAGGTKERRPTRAPAEGVMDLPADRKSWLGNAFVIPWRDGGGRQRDERYRDSVVAATRMMLDELEEMGHTDAQRIAADGPGGDGWLIGGQRVTLPLDREHARADLFGHKRWQAVQHVAGLVERGQDVRLLCHCRWTRRQAPGCMRCHCEPTAEHIEQEARRQRAAAEAKQMREAKEERGRVAQTEQEAQRQRAAAGMARRQGAEEERERAAREAMPPPPPRTVRGQGQSGEESRTTGQDGGLGEAAAEQTQEQRMRDLEAMRRAGLTAEEVATAKRLAEELLERLAGDTGVTTGSGSSTGGAALCTSSGNGEEQRAADGSADGGASSAEGGAAGTAEEGERRKRGTKGKKKGAAARREKKRGQE